MFPLLRLCLASFYVVGPLAALVALWSRRSATVPVQYATASWRRHVPALLLPFEWLMPPVLLLTGFGEVEADWLAVRLAGFLLALGGAVVVLLAPFTLGRFLVHKAVVFEDHALVTTGPYRFVRHPVYAGYLALLLGSGLGSLNACLLIFWPVSLLGILLQARAEDDLLALKFGSAWRDYCGRAGLLLPRFRRLFGERRIP